MFYSHENSILVLLILVVNERYVKAADEIRICEILMQNWKSGIFMIIAGVLFGEVQMWNSSNYWKI